MEKTIDNLRKKHLDDFSCLYETVSYDLSKKYSLSELAKKHYLSEKKISRLFQIHTGMTFKKYYLKMRVDKAIELKKKNIYTDEEITEMVGYWDVRSLKRAIRRMEQYW
ncbi:MAG: helix-turn-helix domain-containing protein [Streptococcaceae bacterium]|nr:helix-turn-helix domain-containing protein [Streptococcaceae bacterium]